MPKMKSVRGAVKRFRKKKSGKIKRGSAYRSHLLTKKRPARIRRLKKIKYVDATNVKSVRIMIEV